MSFGFTGHFSVLTPFFFFRPYFIRFSFASFHGPARPGTRLLRAHRVSCPKRTKSRPAAAAQPHSRPRPPSAPAPRLARAPPPPRCTTFTTRSPSEGLMSAPTLRGHFPRPNLPLDEAPSATAASPRLSPAGWLFPCPSPDRLHPTEAGPPPVARHPFLSPKPSFCRRSPEPCGTPLPPPNTHPKPRRRVGLAGREREGRGAGRTGEGPRQAARAGPRARVATTPAPFQAPAGEWRPGSPSGLARRLSPRAGGRLGARTRGGGRARRARPAGRPEGPSGRAGPRPALPALTQQR